MPQSVLKQITDLLNRAKTEHGEYEASVLNGVYDEDWDMWYASWLVEHGINDLLNVDLHSTDLATLLSDVHEQFKEDAESRDWADYTAEQIIATVA